MTVAVDYNLKVTTTETIGNNTVSATATNRKVVHDALNITAAMDGASSPPVSGYAAFLLTLSGGVATIDLTSLLTTNGATLNGSTKKVQMIRIKNLGANKMTFAKGASSGHGSFTDDGQDVQPGGEFFTRTMNAGDTIDATHKTWDVAGTTTQTANVEVWVG